MLLNPKGIAEYSVALADKIEPWFTRGVPLVLGGDCSIVLGCLLALRRRGRYGLLFLDGHADSLPGLRRSRTVRRRRWSSRWPLAAGPWLSPTLRAVRPLVRDEDVVAFGRRDAEDCRGAWQPAHRRHRELGFANDPKRTLHASQLTQRRRIVGLRQETRPMAETSRHDTWQAADRYEAYMGR